MTLRYDDSTPTSAQRTLKLVVSNAGARHYYGLKQSTSDGDNWVDLCATCNINTADRPRLCVGCVRWFHEG